MILAVLRGNLHEIKKLHSRNTISLDRATKRHSSNSNNNNNVIDKVTAKLRRSLSFNPSLKENHVPSTSSDESQSSSKVKVYEV